MSIHNDLEEVFATSKRREERAYMVGFTDAVFGLLGFTVGLLIFWSFIS